MPFAVIRDLLRDLLDELRPLGARPHETHAAGQHIEQLRRFLDARYANEAAAEDHPRVVLLCLLCTVLLRGLAPPRANGAVRALGNRRGFEFAVHGLMPCRIMHAVHVKVRRLRYPVTWLPNLT